MKNNNRTVTDSEVFPLILTGTINPDLAYDSNTLSKRVKSYYISIEKYIRNTRFNPIVFVDNSNYQFDVAKFEQIAKESNKVFEFVKGTICSEEVKQHGKGYGDSLLVYEALTKSKCMENIDFFYKITGRIFLKNSDEIIKSFRKHKNEFISYDGMGWVMTYIFKANKADYLKTMDKVWLQCDDKSLRDMEICFWLRLYHSDLDIGCFKAYPIIEGNMGASENPYTKGGLDFVLRTVGIKFGIFKMKSVGSKMFWKLYMLVRGRKPYVTPLDK